MRFAIWHHLYNLKNVKNTHGGVLLLVKLQAESSTPPWVFSTFFKLCIWYQIVQRIKFDFFHWFDFFLCSDLRFRFWITYRFLYAMRHNDANNRTHTPYYMRHCQIFDKVRLHLWRTASFTYDYWLAFFSSIVDSTRKKEPSWRNYLIWTTHWVEERNTPDTQNTIVAMQMILWTEDIFCFISDCRNYSTANWKSL